ncbi:unnamed protein product [Vitrella brassicaformis CCMP3155]|uniref:Uncharacterized protein n=1 Tax=Vitrella brassicaformis (strain CCMP3155) TaxID=1169540 RepID=A0A0G4EQS2_VITBC|nr:unnamed protein product [Vitrella brassicaformis CCMP3155]|eukprot:CEL99817.1 unnamed protein product [Vitrella brassicaformis CCMP3155]
MMSLRIAREFRENLLREWGGAARLRSPNLSYRLFLLTDKTTSPFLAYFHVLREEAANSVSVSVGVFCDEGAPYDGTRELFVRCMGAEMGMRVREEIDERRRCSCAER